MHFDMTKCLEAFSLLLDYAEMDYFKVSLNHSRRVAYMAVSIAREAGLPDEDVMDLYALGLLHDNGLTAAGLVSRPLQYELYPSHCEIGEENIVYFPLQRRRPDAVRYHHENFDGTGVYGLKGEDIPRLSRIIRIADMLDVTFDLPGASVERRTEILDFVSEQRDRLFFSDVVDVFVSLAAKERFWDDLAFYNISEVLARIAPKIYYEYTWEDIVPISKTMMKIIDSKSTFTARHSKGLTEKTGIMSEYYGFDLEKTVKLQIAANLHDLGKMYVPNAILDKPSSLDEHESGEIKKHTYFTRLALDKIPGFEDVARWASSHHEKLDGKGYPEGLKARELDFESRLLGVVDIYQALSEERPYRKALPHDEAMKKIYGMVDNGLIDRKIADDVDKVMGADRRSEPEKTKRVS